MNELHVIINALEKITSQTGSRFDWDDLLSIKFTDERAESLRQLFWKVSDAFPGKNDHLYSNAGMNVLKVILESLKSEISE